MGYCCGETECCTYYYELWCRFLSQLFWSLAQLLHPHSRLKHWILVLSVVNTFVFVLLDMLQLKCEIIPHPILIYESILKSTLVSDIGYAILVRAYFMNYVCVYMLCVCVYVVYVCVYVVCVCVCICGVCVYVVCVQGSGWCGPSSSCWAAAVRTVTGVWRCVCSRNRGRERSVWWPLREPPAPSSPHRPSTCVRTHTHTTYTHTHYIHTHPP